LGLAAICGQPRGRSYKGGDDQIRTGATRLSGIRISVNAEKIVNVVLGEITAAMARRRCRASRLWREAPLCSDRPQSAQWRALSAEKEDPAP
jgi:hypothetical protein